MKKLLVATLLCIAFACVHKAEDTPEELKAKLNATMTAYLYKSINNDSSKVKYHITDVIYSDIPNGWVCEFTVKMHEERPDRIIDTTGHMSARISTDFQTVFRRY